MRLDQTIIVNADDAFVQVLNELLARKCAPWTDEAIPMLREAFVRAEDALTDRQREALTIALESMTPKDWDAFGAAMVYHYGDDEQC